VIKRETLSAGQNVTYAKQMQNVDGTKGEWAFYIFNSVDVVHKSHKTVRKSIRNVRRVQMKNLFVNICCHATGDFDSHSHQWFLFIYLVSFLRVYSQNLVIYELKVSLIPMSAARLGTRSS
jgi:hypothetical protein